MFKNWKLPKDWRTWFARDSTLWRIMFKIGGFLLVVVSVMNVSSDVHKDYRINQLFFNWLQLLITAATTFSAKMGLSWASSSAQIKAGSPIAAEPPCKS